MSGIIKPPFGAKLLLDHPLAKGLVGCWLMNETSGNKVYDSSGQNNTGTLINMANPPIPTSGWVPGPHGPALAFDGSNDYVDCGNSPSLNFGTGNFSFCINFFPIASVVSFPGIIDKSKSGDWTGAPASQAGFVLLDGNPGYADRWRFCTGSGSGVYNQVMLWKTYAPESSWNYIVGVQDATTIKLYAPQYNFVVSSNRTDYGSIDVTNSLIFGFWRYNSKHKNCLISSVSIYNRALTAQEVAELYARPYCMFDEGFNFCYTYRVNEILYGNSNITLQKNIVSPITTSLNKSSGIVLQKNLSSPVVGVLDKTSPITTLLSKESTI